jgi:hypothetical protein
MRCYWAKDAEIGRFHVPGCWGSAIYGPDGCTCGSGDRRKSLEETIVKLEARIERLEKANAPRKAATDL